MQNENVSYLLERVQHISNHLTKYQPTKIKDIKIKYTKILNFNQYDNPGSVIISLLNVLATLQNKNINVYQELHDDVAHKTWLLLLKTIDMMDVEQVLETLRALQSISVSWASQARLNGVLIFPEVLAFKLVNRWIDCTMRVHNVESLIGLVDVAALPMFFSSNNRSQWGGDNYHNINQAVDRVGHRALDLCPQLKQCPILERFHLIRFLIRGIQYTNIIKVVEVLTSKDIYYPHMASLCNKDIKKGIDQRIAEYVQRSKRDGIFYYEEFRHSINKLLIFSMPWSALQREFSALRTAVESMHHLARKKGFSQEMQPFASISIMPPSLIGDSGETNQPNSILLNAHDEYAMRANQFLKLNPKAITPKIFIPLISEAIILYKNNPSLLRADQICKVLIKADQSDCYSRINAIHTRNLLIDAFNCLQHSIRFDNASDTLVFQIIQYAKYNQFVFEKEVQKHLLEFGYLTRYYEAHEAESLNENQKCMPDITALIEAFLSNCSQKPRPNVIRWLLHIMVLIEFPFKHISLTSKNQLEKIHDQKAILSYLIEKIAKTRNSQYSRTFLISLMKIWRYDPFDLSDVHKASLHKILITGFEFWNLEDRIHIIYILVSSSANVNTIKQLYDNIVMSDFSTSKLSSRTLFKLNIILWHLRLLQHSCNDALTSMDHKRLVDHIKYSFKRASIFDDVHAILVNSLEGKGERVKKDYPVQWMFVAPIYIAKSNKRGQSRSMIVMEQHLFSKLPRVIRKILEHSKVFTLVDVRNKPAKDVANEINQMLNSYTSGKIEHTRERVRSRSSTSSVESTELDKLGAIRPASRSNHTAESRGYINAGNPNFFGSSHTNGCNVASRDPRSKRRRTSSSASLLNGNQKPSSTM